jgi:hypothetical protein
MAWMAPIGLGIWEYLLIRQDCASEAHSWGGVLKQHCNPEGHT